GPEGENGARRGRRRALFLREGEPRQVSHRGRIRGCRTQQGRRALGQGRGVGILLLAGQIAPLAVLAGGKTRKAPSPYPRSALRLEPSEEGEGCEGLARRSRAYPQLGESDLWARAAASVQPDPGGLELGVLRERMDRLVAPEARLLEAAEGGRHVALVEAVHPDHAGAQRLSGAVCGVDVARPHRGREAVDGVVADAHGLLRVLEGDGREHGPEDLLARDLHAVVDLVEHGRLDVIAARLGARALAAHLELGTLLLARLDVAEHALELGLVDDRPHARLGVERVAGLEALADLDDLREEGVLDGSVDQEPRARVAHLALVEEDAEGGGLGRGLEVRAVRHHDVRRLAAAL